MASMIRLGLTGGIGMGKSMAAKFLAKRGAKISDSDEIARALVEPDAPARDNFFVPASRLMVFKQSEK